MLEEAVVVAHGEVGLHLRSVSSATPTMMRSDVPPKKLAMSHGIWIQPARMVGRMAMTTRPMAPMKVTRDIVWSRNSAVARPGRMPGT